MSDPKTNGDGPHPGGSEQPPDAPSQNGRGDPDNPLGK